MSHKRSASSNTTSGGVAGLTFLDNSQMSVSEKIHLYFAQQQTTTIAGAKSSHHLQTNATARINDNNSNAQLDSSSSAASSNDFDASFQLLLDSHREEQRLRQTRLHNNDDTETDATQIKTEHSSVIFSPAQSQQQHDTMANDGQRIAQTRTAVESNTDDENIIDLCSPATPESRKTSPSTVNRSIWKHQDSLLVAAPDDDWLGVSDESFLEQERLCQSPVSSEYDVSILADVEAPSAFWNDTICDTTIAPASVSPADDRRVTVASHTNVNLLHPMRTLRGRVSTIPEESTLNSTNSTCARSASSSNNSSSAASTRRRQSDDVAEVLPSENKRDSQQCQANHRRSVFDTFPKRREPRKYYPDAEQVSPATAMQMLTIKPANPSESVKSVANTDATLSPMPSTSSSTSGILTAHNRRPSPDRFSPSVDLFRRQCSQPAAAGALPPTKSPSGFSGTQNLSIFHVPAGKRLSPLSTPQPRPVANVRGRESIALMTFDDTLHSDDDDDADDNIDQEDDPLNTAIPDFNDTIEAMDFFIEKGLQLERAARGEEENADPTTPLKATQAALTVAVSQQPPVVRSSPKSASRTSDTIRRRLLVRNFMRSSGASPQLQSAQLDDSLE